MATFHFKNGEYTWCVDGKIRSVRNMGQLTIDGDRYILHCRTTPQYAREKFYQMEHPYDFELDGADIPHDLRVWLVDNAYRIGTYVHDRCTVQDAIAYIESHKKCWDDMQSVMSDMIVEGSNTNLIVNDSTYRVSLKMQHEFDDDGTKHSERMPWESHPEQYQEFLERIRKLNIELSAIQEKNTAEKRLAYETQEREKRDIENERKRRVREAIEKSEAPEMDLMRFDDGMMSDDDQHDYLRRRFIMIPDGFKLFSDITPDEFCVCEYSNDLEEYDFEIIDATELTRDEYYDFKILTDTIYAGENIQVTAKREVCYCNGCDHKIDKTFFQVEMKIGDFTVFRRIERKEREKKNENTA